ncbi:MAG: hypothetical protein K5773_04765 [Pseudobutyrivibrio sp.]|nr:hypothetical protein [Pseudobutyrivibrio sp.]
MKKSKIGFAALALASVLLLAPCSKVYAADDSQPVVIEDSQLQIENNNTKDAKEDGKTDSSTSIANDEYTIQDPDTPTSGNPVVVTATGILNRLWWGIFIVIPVAAGVIIAFVESKKRSDDLSLDHDEF